MQNLKDEEIMLKYQEGEPGAMDELLGRYKNPLYRFAFRLTGNIAEAQDITQEVFLRVHQHRYDYRPLGKFSTWIFSIAHNLAVSGLRKRKRFVIWPRKEDESEELKEFPSSDPSPEEVVAENEISALVRNSVQGLPFLQREALILREYQDLDYQDIARILNKSLGTVKTLIYRARENLKIKLLGLKEEFGGGYHG